MAVSYTRRISNLGGIGGPELLFSENLLRLYPRDGGASRIVTAPGYRRIAELGERCNGIFRFGEITTAGKTRELLLVHAGGWLYATFLDGDGEMMRVGALGDAPSFGFRFGAYFYLLDGESYRRVSVTSGIDLPTVTLEEVPTYQPTEAHEGEAFEAANLLSEQTYERRRILSLESYGEGSPGLRFSVQNAAAREAILVGGEVSGELRVPSFTLIGDEYYRVVGIAPSAFEGNSEIRGVRLGIEIREVGDGAFRACSALTSFSAPGKLEVIGYSAFAACTALASIALGERIGSIRAYATEGCTALTELLYAGEDFSGVSVGLLGNDRLRELSPICSAEIDGFEDPELRFPLLHPADEVLEVTLDGVGVLQETDGALSYRCERDAAGLVTAVILYAENPRGLYEKELLISLSSAHGRRDELSALLSRYPDYVGGIADAVRGCRVGACYDGRIFLGGNPCLPGAVFYSTRTASGEMHPGYFSIYSYFTDGGVGASLLGLLAAPDGLWVFTDEDDGCGIYCHVGVDTGAPLSPRIYPIARGHIADGRYLDATLYRDETLLLTTRGVSAITKTSLGETRLARRDEGVEMLSGLRRGARLGRWLGYLAVLSPEGELWLGDGRRIETTPSGGRRPEWWRLSGISGYRGAKRLYRYASRLTAAGESAGLALAPPELMGERIPSEVYLEGELCYALLNGQKAEAVWQGEEMLGEALGFSALLSFDDELLFGDSLGTIYRFSTDRRGIPASSALSEYSESELIAFARHYPDYLAPEWYHYDRHEIPVRLCTSLDDCDRPGEKKSTEVSSTLVGCRAKGRFELIAITDDGRRFGEGLFGGGSLDFETLAFDTIAFDAGETAPTVFRESTKKWHRKQYLLRADGIGAPLEISEISYRFAVVGKVKSI